MFIYDIPEAEERIAAIPSLTALQHYCHPAVTISDAKKDPPDKMPAGPFCSLSGRG
jgi:hypothetical protein